VQTIENKIEYRIVTPNPALRHFVESFWMIKNPSNDSKEIVVLPDGKFDIIFSHSLNEPYTVMQMGLGTKPDQNTFPPQLVMFAVSFKLLAIEYLLQTKAGSLLDNAQTLPMDFWGVTRDDLDDFDRFCDKISAKMLTLVTPDIDTRKQKLFELIYSSNGSLTVKELSEQVHWSSRQINRYFNEQFGISLKAYCNILRFRASLPQLKEGKLFPEQNFTDQTHFIKEIKRFSGVVPKELARNHNDRFILLSVLPKK
jgi:AraC-like DNA-binding protein